MSRDHVHEKQIYLEEVLSYPSTVIMTLSLPQETLLSRSLLLVRLGHQLLKVRPGWASKMPKRGKKKAEEEVLPEEKEVAGECRCAT